jgi:hypothetical protein
MTAAHPAWLALIPAWQRSGDDVGDKHVCKQSEFVAQLELAFLEALQLDHVGIGHLAQRLDRCIKVAVIASGDLDSRPNFGLFHAIRSLAAESRRNG